MCDQTTRISHENVPMVALNNVGIFMVTMQRKCEEKDMWETCVELKFVTQVSETKLGQSKGEKVALNRVIFNPLSCPSQGNNEL